MRGKGRGITRRECLDGAAGTLCLLDVTHVLARAVTRPSSSDALQLTCFLHRNITLASGSGNMPGVSAAVVDALYPGLAITVTVLAANLFGNRLRD
jgi:hypothetical protein